jgi:hypothetical protein
VRISPLEHKEIDLAAAQADVRERLCGSCRQMRRTCLWRRKRTPKRARLRRQAFAAHAGP